MSYGMADALQTAVFARLVGAAELGTLVGPAIYDAVPQAAPDLFVAIGQERVAGRADVSGRGAVHDFMVSVVTTRDGYLPAKQAAARVSDALLGGDLTLTRGRVVHLRFLRARARRDEGEGTRRIDLSFRARLDDENI